MSQQTTHRISAVQTALAGRSVVDAAVAYVDALQRQQQRPTAGGVSRGDAHLQDAFHRLLASVGQYRNNRPA